MAHRVGLLLLCGLGPAAFGWVVPDGARAAYLQQIQQQPRVHFIKTGVVISEGHILTITGGAHIEVGEWEIRAQSVVGNLRTREFVLSGEALALTDDLRLDADLIELSLATETFRFENGRAVIGPGVTGGRTQDDLYIYARIGGGTRYEMELVDGYVTTCPPHDEQFRLGASSARIWPGDRIALKEVTLHVLDAKVVSVPALVIPLRPGSERYVPAVGHSPDEGYFLKTRFALTTDENSYVDMLVDVFTKLGLGLGAQYIYDHATSQGEVRVSSLIGQENSRVLQASHHQSFGSDGLSFNARMEQNNYLTAPDSTIYNARAQYVMPHSTGQTRYGFSLFGSDRSGFRSLNNAFTIADTRRFDIGAHAVDTLIDLNYNSAETGGVGGFATDSQRVDVRFNANSNLGSFDAELLYRRSVPITGDAGFLSASDRTPQVTLSSDARRLFGQGLADIVPFRTSISWGEIANPSQGNTIQRVFFDWAFQRTDGELARAGRLQWGGRLRQGLYSDDTAQYVVDASAQYSVRMWDQVSANLNYRYLEPKGFTPLSIDRTGRNHALNFDVTYEPNSRARVSARSGYDILRSEDGQIPWQLVFLDAHWKPSDEFSLSAFSTYDTINSVWATTRVNVDWDFGDAQFAAGIRYDGRRQELAGVSLYLQGLQIGKLRAGALIDYNGYSGRLDAQHYQFIYDMGCTEAVLEFVDNNVGFRSGQQIGFYIRIKALPAGGPFGIGQRGQAIGSLPGGIGY